MYGSLGGVDLNGHICFRLECGGDYGDVDLVITSGPRKVALRASAALYCSMGIVVLALMAGFSMAKNPSIAAVPIAKKTKSITRTVDGETVIGW